MENLKKTDVPSEEEKARERTLTDRRGRQFEEITMGDFDVYEKIEQLEGPFVEVAGPTEGGYTLIDIDALKPREIYISNIFPGAPRYNTDSDGIESYYGNVDFQADARQLPLKDESVGALFVSCFPKSPSIAYHGNTQGENQRLIVIQEALRVLRKGGILVWQGGADEDLEFARGIGFKQRKIIRPFNKKHAHVIDFILEK